MPLLDSDDKLSLEVGFVNLNEPQFAAIKVIFRVEIGSNIEKYKLDTIQFTIFILEDPVIVYGQSCLIAE